MKKKIIILISLVLAMTLVCAAFAGCENKEPEQTTETTTTEAREYIDDTQGKTTEKTVKFGGSEKKLTYKNTLDYGDGVQYDIFTSGNDEYWYIFNTDTFYKISLKNYKISTDEEIVTDINAMSAARGFLSPQYGAMLDYEMRMYDTSSNYYKIVFAAIEGKDAEYSEIMCFLPMAENIAEFWFTAK